MGMKDIIAPAIVRPADELAEYAARINAAHEAGVQSQQRGLEYYRQAGEELKKVQERIGRGFRAWLAANVKFSKSRAYQYIKLASVQNSGQFEQDWEEWQRISDSPKFREEERVPSTSHSAPLADPDSTHAPDDVEADHEPTVEATPREHRPLVTLNTGNEEWYTPPEYLEAARAVLGNIDLDPASCDNAQKNVRATKYYTKEDDGLSHDWAGRVWLNPPYSRDTEDDPGCKSFVLKLCRHFEAGDVTEAIVLTNNATETKWFQPLARLSEAICFPASRIRFLNEQGQPGGPTQGQAVFYLGPNLPLFMRHFSQFGLIFVKGKIDEIS
jgi:phage N-6-adenine-methyltransferase